MVATASIPDPRRWVSGDRAGERYEVKRRLAGGGMAVVCEGWDRQLERPVAIKRLRSKSLDDEIAGARFWREARIGAMLNHPNLIEVLDAGEDTEGPYMIMELVEGNSLAELLGRAGRLPALQGATIAEGAARAVDHMHRHGFVHRDVKPGNILVEGDGSVRLVDLGIHKPIGEPDDLTDPNTVLGTPRYFSPEQARGGEATPASDIYALGVVLYETLTGRLPFEATTPLELAIAHLHQSPVPPSRLAPVPWPLEDVTLRAMEKDPRLRFRSAGELADTLSCWASAAMASVDERDTPLSRLVAIPA